MAEEMIGYTQNRELSWLAFNERILDETMDPTVPLLERLRFLSIFTGNLDEFFMIRVGRLKEMVSQGDHIRERHTGMSASEQLARIYDTVRTLYDKYGSAYAAVQKELSHYGIRNLQPEELTCDEERYIKRYFEEQILPVLSPQIVDPTHPFPQLQNKGLYVIANLKKNAGKTMGIVPVTHPLPEIITLPGKELRYLHTEQLILYYIERIFPLYTVTDENCIRVTRNGNLVLDDELLGGEEDFRYHIQKRLVDRKKLSIVRLEVAQPLEKGLEETILHRCQITRCELFRTSAPMKPEQITAILGQVPRLLSYALTYPAFIPQHTVPNYGGKMLRLAKHRDQLFFFPYESMDPFLRLIREASVDADVLSIKITVYRLAKNARLVDYLCAAAKNGKDVTVIIELRARFDEQNNIDWSERLEAAGCRVIYGFDAYKIHAKVCLITLREKHGVGYITQIGTGNYNEKTVCQYTDLSLITGDERIGKDAAAFFNRIAIGNLDGVYDHLLVSPVNLKERLLKEIEREGDKGPAGHIVIKCNSVTDCDLIAAISHASQRGTKVELIVRGICCILPGVPGKTENVRVTSIVGRFLEHGRIYAFGNGEEQRIYMGSADMRTRNTEHRVEVLTPVYDPALREKISRYLAVQLEDTAKARQLLPDGTYQKKTQIGCAPVCAQEKCIEQANAHGTSAREHQKRPRMSTAVRTFAGKYFP